MIKLYALACNRPEFTELQLASFRKHLKEDFELIVLNNAACTYPEDFPRLTKVCENLGIKSIDIQMEQELMDKYAEEQGHPILTERDTYYDPNVGCAYPWVWAWKNILSKETGNIAMMDSDMFLIKDISFSDYLVQHQLAYVPQSRKNVQEYMWNGFVLFNMDSLPAPEAVDWWAGRVNGTGVDVGGQTYHYLQAYPNLNPLRLCPAPYPYGSETISFNGVPHILHYRSGSNWNRQTIRFHDQKIQWLRRML